MSSSHPDGRASGGLWNKVVSVPNPPGTICNLPEACVSPPGSRRSTFFLKTALALILAGTTNSPAAVRYVNVNSAKPAAPYTTWATAAVTIQRAVDASVAGDEIVVTNGVYSPFKASKTLEIRSVKGAEVTGIDGGGSNRCATLSEAVTLTGFTLTRGQATNGAGAYGGNLNQCVVSANSAIEGGGGVYSSHLNNCTLAGNSAGNWGGGAYASALSNCSLTGNSAGIKGGGATGSALTNCLLSGNSVWGNGGGAADSTLHHCTLTNNAASQGGGANGGTLINCILTRNRADRLGWGGDPIGGLGGGANAATLISCTLVDNSAYYGGGANRSELSNCALNRNWALVWDIGYPHRAYGGEGAGAYWSGLGHCVLDWWNYHGSKFCTFSDCVEGDPLFVDYSSGNLRLQSNSPCINAGNNASIVGSTDLDGNPRIAGSTVDVGAYEFQGTGLSGFIGWLWQYGLRTDGTANHADTDFDRMNNWQEWRCDTNPTNATSVLHFLSVAKIATGFTFTWQSTTNRAYWLERASDPGAPLKAFELLTTNIVGQTPTTIYTDTNAVGDGPFFYRVGVH